MANIMFDPPEQVPSIWERGLLSALLLPAAIIGIGVFMVRRRRGRGDMYIIKRSGR